MNNHYAILGVLPSASFDEIRASYRQLVKRFHPDIPGGSARFFARIREAYEVLSVPQSRKEYDTRWRNPAQRPHRNAAGSAGRKKAPPQSKGPQPQRPQSQRKADSKAAPQSGAQSKVRPKVRSKSRPAAGAGAATGTEPSPPRPRKSRKNGSTAPISMLTRVMSIAVPRTGKFQLSGVIGNIRILPTTEENLWDTTVAKYKGSPRENLARHVIQIKLSGERDLVRTMMPRPTDFGVEFQSDSDEEKRNKIRIFIENLLGKGSLAGMFTQRPFGLYGAFLPLNLLVTVPVGTPLILRDITGTLDVGDVEGEVSAKLLGGVLRAGRIEKANLTLNGGSRAFLSRVGGDVDLMGFGKSKTYLGGAVSRLRAVLDNEAQAEVNARVKSLLAEVNGNALLHIKQPVYEAFCNVNDNGHVRLNGVIGRLAGTRSPGGRLDAEPPRRRMNAAG